ncbi:MAG: ATP synthase F1 subunit epsilon [Candidatus Uhrbacteria bacterium]|nr:ATP synthase F1 subunit epsilon [Candidatus Uhrbacteria bacterium]
MPLNYKIITPERVLLEGQADAITIMTVNGEITVLPKHEPLVALLRAGEMKVRKGSEVTHIAASTGLLEVRGNNEVIILADTAERSDELELATIEEAKRRAEEALKNIKNRNDVAFADAAAHMERELARYRVAIKRKGVRQPGMRSGE